MGFCAMTSEQRGSWQLQSPSASQRWESGFCPPGLSAFSLTELSPQQPSANALEEAEVFPTARERSLERRFPSAADLFRRWKLESVLQSLLKRQARDGTLAGAGRGQEDAQGLEALALVQKNLSLLRRAAFATAEEVAEAAETLHRAFPQSAEEQAEALLFGAKRKDAVSNDNDNGGDGVFALRPSESLKGAAEMPIPAEEAAEIEPTDAFFEGFAVSSQEALETFLGEDHVPRESPLASREQRHGLPAKRTRDSQSAGKEFKHRKQESRESDSRICAARCASGMSNQASPLLPGGRVFSGLPPS